MSGRAKLWLNVPRYFRPFWRCWRCGKRRWRTWDVMAGDYQCQACNRDLWLAAGWTSVEVDSILRGDFDFSHTGTREISPKAES